ncbi:MAG TPA: glycosyl hydrolase family 18 protein [Candidatus Bathyarchaeia archaeon]|nr:glycosyl hydrolase family 18 protein [Candidatus Bathyarchaeia archaeon]
MKLKLGIFLSLLISAVGFFLIARFRKQTAELIWPFKTGPSAPVAGIASLSGEKTGNRESADIQFSAWLPWWSEDEVAASLKVAALYLKTILPVWYRLEPDGKIREIEVANKEVVLAIAADNRAEILPSLANDFDGRRVAKLLADGSLRESLLKDLVRIAKDNQYRGWDLDWEGLKPADKDAYSRFVADLASVLHQNGLLLSVSVYAQTGEAADQWEGLAGQDYQALAESADQLRIMAYDFHNENSRPGPVTPLDKLEAVIDFNLKNLPREKIVLGIPTYGYDWGPDKGEPVEYRQARERLSQFQGTTNRDPLSSSLVGRYRLDGVGHEIWFEDRESISRKLEIAKKQGIRQFCFWRLGGEDSRLWSQALGQN